MTHHPRTPNPTPNERHCTNGKHHIWHGGFDEAKKAVDPKLASCKRCGVCAAWWMVWFAEYDSD